MPWRDGIIQLYGANTDVGKTLVSVGLVREALKRREGAHGVLYLKPMQTVRRLGGVLPLRWKQAGGCGAAEDV